MVIRNFQKRLPNVLCLPGNANPENVFRRLLEDMPPDHVFWQNDLRYTKQVFERELSKQTSGRYDDRNKMKAWFNNQKKFWGRGGSNIFKCWLAHYPEQAEDFRTQFVRVYNEIAKRRSIPTI